MFIPKQEKKTTKRCAHNIDLFYQFFIESNDARVNAIVSFFGDMNGKKVLDVGCGAGRFPRVLKNRFKKINLYGLDIAEKKLRYCPRGIRIVCGSMRHICYPDNYFDSVYCVEALEYVRTIEEPIKEMVRVLKPLGKIIIIDKNRDAPAHVRKLLKADPWGRWFRPKGIMGLLEKCGIRAFSKILPYDKRSIFHNLFIAWEGVKVASWKQGKN